MGRFLDIFSLRFTLVQNAAMERESLCIIRMVDLMLDQLTSSAK